MCFGMCVSYVCVCVFSCMCVHVCVYVGRAGPCLLGAVSRICFNKKIKKLIYIYLYFVFKQPLSFMPLAWPVCGYGCACVCLHAHVNLYEGLCVFLFV